MSIFLSVSWPRMFVIATLFLLYESIFVAAVWFRGRFINNSILRPLAIFFGLLSQAAVMMVQLHLCGVSDGNVAHKTLAEAVLSAESFGGICLIFITELFRSKAAGTKYGQLK